MGFQPTVAEKCTVYAMAGPPSASFALATLVFGGVGLPSKAVTTFGMIAPDAQPDRAAIAALFATFHEDNFSVDVTLESIEFKIGPEATGPTFVEVVNQPGLVTGESAGPENACLIHKRIDDVSGRLHGRSFWPGLAESQVTTNGNIASGSLSFLQTGADALYNGLFTLGFSLEVFPSVGESSRPVSSLEVDGTTATQRLRKRR